MGCCACWTPLVCGRRDRQLRWREVQERKEGGQVTVLGKGGKTRSVLLPPSVWEELVQLSAGTGADTPVCASRKVGGVLTTTQVPRLVYQAAKAGLSR